MHIKISVMKSHDKSNKKTTAESHNYKNITLKHPVFLILLSGKNYIVDIFLFIVYSTTVQCKISSSEHHRENMLTGWNQIMGFCH